MRMNETMHRLFDNYNDVPAVDSAEASIFAVAYRLQTTQPYATGRQQDQPHSYHQARPPCAGSELRQRCAHVCYLGHRRLRTRLVMDLVQEGNMAASTGARVKSAHNLAGYTGRWG